jgi:hypothetical protein
MADDAAARRLSAVAAALRPGPGPGPGAGTRAGAGQPPGPATAADSAAQAADPAVLRPGEFLLAVQDPPRLVPGGLLVRARVPRVIRDGPVASPRRAWEGG